MTLVPPPPLPPLCPCIQHDFWGRQGVHYHQGMAAGENTLNALCCRLITRTIAASKGFDPQAALAAYVTFMTTPGSHNDTYAESFHRDFFSNWARGVAPEQCARGTEGHNTAQIGGFVMLPPVVLSALGGGGAGGASRAVSLGLDQLRLTHDSGKLEGYAKLYAGLLYDVASGKDLKQSVRATAATLGLNLDRLLSADDLSVVHSTFGSACYIDSSMPVVLYLAYKYSDDFEKAVLQNTNVGGENCHRGAALGALMGAAVGKKGLPQRFVSGLKDTQRIHTEVEAYMTALFPEAAAA